MNKKYIATEPIKEENIPFIAYATTLNRIGDELISNPIVALSEIIKNSYDADATKVEISFEGLQHGKGKVLIADNGHGMDEKALKKCWFQVSTSTKNYQRVSPKGRIQLGKKGIGRFSVMRLSDTLRLKTKRSLQNYFIVAKFDWGKYRNNEDDQLSEVMNNCTYWPTTGDNSSYTILEMKGLRDKWTENKISKLIDDLSSELINPIKKYEDFEIFITCKAFPYLSGKIENKLLDGVTHKLDFQMDEQGNYRVNLNGTTLKQEKTYPLICGPIGGQLNYFKDGIKGKFKKQSGVKIFRDGFLVRPYGCGNNDWLDLKTRRSSLGGKMLQPGYLVGIIDISEELNPSLKDTSNREGMDEGTEEYEDFKDFIQKQVQSLDKIIMEETYKASTQKKQTEYKDALDVISEVLTKLSYSPILQKSVLEADKKYHGKPGEIPVFESVLDENGLKGERKTHEFNGNHKEKEKIDWPGAPRIKHRRRKQLTERSTLRKSKLSISGKIASVGGIVLSPFIDDTLGESDVEAFISPADRKLYINPNHPMFRYSETTDEKNEKSVGTGLTIEAPATTIHIYKSAAVAWASFHASKEKSGEYDKEEFDSRYEEMLREISKLLSKKI